MNAERNLQRQTHYLIRVLHAHENLRLGWYRQLAAGGEQLRVLRERKANHTAFLHELLRNRGIAPMWYARGFYYGGHLLGWASAFLPRVWVSRIENLLEGRILRRYKRYTQRLELWENLRTMVEAVQLKRLAHNEPAQDVLKLLRQHIQSEEQLLLKPKASGL